MPATTELKRLTGRQLAAETLSWYELFTVYEPDGFVLIYKRLTASHGRYRWPRNRSEVRNLTWREFDWLMSGIDIDQPKAIRAS